MDKKMEDITDSCKDLSNKLCIVKGLNEALKIVDKQQSKTDITAGIISLKRKLLDELTEELGK